MRAARLTLAKAFLWREGRLRTPMTNAKKLKRRRRPTHVQLLTEKDLRKKEEKREQDFLRRWRAHLEQDKKEKAWATYWQDLKAIAEMKDVGCFDAMRAASTERDRIFWMLLFREVAIYRSNYASCVRRNREFEQVRRLLDSLIERVKKFQPKSDLSSLLLKDILHVLESEAARLPEKRREFQSNTLNYTPEELSKPFVPVSSIEAGKPEFEYQTVADCRGVGSCRLQLENSCDCDHEGESRYAAPRSPRRPLPPLLSRIKLAHHQSSNRAGIYHRGTHPGTAGKALYLASRWKASQASHQLGESAVQSYARGIDCPDDGKEAAKIAP